MEITIQNTTEMVVLNGLPCRIWKGETKGGIAVFCFVPLVAVMVDANQADFIAELQAVEPLETPRAFPLRMVL